MFVLKERKYNWLDMWRMPFACAPFCTVAVTLQKFSTALANVFQVIVVAKFLDEAIASLAEKSFSRETFLWLGLTLLVTGWKRISFLVGAVFTQRAIIQANQQVAWEAAKKRDRLEYASLEDPATEELINRITGKLEQTLWMNLQWFLNLFAINIPRIAGVLIIMGGCVWWLPLLVLALTMPVFFFSLKNGKRVYQAVGEAALYERRHKYLFSILTGRESVEERSLFGYTGKVNEKWHGQYEEARKLNLRSQMLYVGNILRGTAINSVLAVIVVLAMIPLTVRGQLTAGIFISLVTSLYDLIELMGKNTSRAFNQVAEAQEFMKDFTAFAALPERHWNSGTPDGAGSGAAAFQTLELRHVTFRYPGTEAVILKDLSLTLQQGGHYAVVGENGAGKSTLIKLMLGFYRDYEGEILYNGREMRTFSQEEWFRNFSCVFQDFARYYLSVEENICLGTGDLGPEEEETEKQRAFRRRRMEEAAGLLDLTGAVSGLKDGYRTRLGKLDEDSVDLSGGQWQRVAMARAMMNDAALLILDEPTAALDPVSESRLYEEFGRISRGRTTVFISHRLGSTRLSDTIFVLKDGRVKEAGSHEELMASGGVYAQMYQTQQSWYQAEGRDRAERSAE